MGAAPLAVVRGWTLPQVAALVLKAGESARPDPFALKPGERYRGER